jgi:hypothetical protein
VKRKLWSSLDEVAPERTIFASNTSSISIDELAAAVSPERRQRFAGMHFFSPVPVMPLVELIRGSATTEDTEAAIRDLTEGLGKKLIVSADRPGFIVNRILMPMLAEAMRILEEGSATADDIDTGAKVGLNHPMGPLELADFIGLVVCLNVINVLNEGIGEEHYPPPRILVDLVEAGPELAFHVAVLEDGLDHQVGGSGRGEVGRGRHPGENRVSLLGRELALRDRAIEVGGDPLLDRLCPRGVRLVEHDVLADRGVHLPDAVAHQARAGDEDVLDGHRVEG